MSNVMVQCLGSGDAFGSGGRYQTCYYVEADSVCFLIDCGSTALIAMKRYGVDPSRIGVVVLSHLHGDHFGGIPFIIRETQIIAQRSNPLVIAGPPGVETRVKEAMEVFFPGSTRVANTFALEFVELSYLHSTAVGALEVAAYPVVHTQGTCPHALRIACDGRIISYSGDAEWTDALIQAADGADLFICEAYTFAKTVRNHMNYQTLMHHLDDLRCKRLVLTHMNDDMLAHPAGIHCEGAEDGMRIVL